MTKWKKWGTHHEIETAVHERISLRLGFLVRTWLGLGSWLGLGFLLLKLLMQVFASAI